MIWWVANMNNGSREFAVLRPSASSDGQWCGRRLRCFLRLPSSANHLHGMNCAGCCATSALMGCPFGSGMRRHHADQAHGSGNDQPHTSMKLAHEEKKLGNVPSFEAKPSWPITTVFTWYSDQGVASSRRTCRPRSRNACCGCLPPPPIRATDTVAPSASAAAARSCAS